MPAEPETGAPDATAAAPSFAVRLKAAAALFAAGDHAAVRALAEALVTEDPDSFDAVHLLGTSLAVLGQLGLACVVLRQAVALQPANAQARQNLARALDRLGRPEQAVAELELANAAFGDSIAVAMNLAAAHLAAGRQFEAMAIWRRIAVERPETVEAHRQMGETLHALRRFGEAVESLRRALRLQPDDPAILAALGKSLIAEDGAGEAVACYRRALALSTIPAAAYWNGLGLALLADGQPGDATAAFDRALQIRSDYASARWNRSLALLSLGRFEEGWRDYELRWHTEVFRGVRRLPLPFWTGREEIAGKTILIAAEQGHGDTIQFVRLAPLVAARGAGVVLQVQASLQSLIRSMRSIGPVLALGEAPPPADLQCSMLSLPHALGIDLATIPAAVPYLEPSGRTVAQWQRRLPQTGLPRIGVVWAGTPAHNHDRSRSIPLASWRPLIERRDFTWIALQKDIGSADMEVAWSMPQLHLLGRHVESFEDTAAIIASLDLVISVDTSVAHLAGAMAKPVWILLPTGADFRWLQETDRSPWYPTARLFRRGRGRPWPELIAQVGSALDVFAKTLQPADTDSSTCGAIPA